MLKKIKLTPKLLLVYALLFAMSSFIVGYANYVLRKSFVEDQLKQTLDENHELVTRDVNTSFDDAVRDFKLFEDTRNADSYFRSLDNNNVDPQSGLSKSELEFLLKKEIGSIVANKKNILQVSLLDINGREVISYIRNDNGAIEVLKDDLNNLGDSELYNGLVQTKVGEIYTSDLSPLNFDQTDFAKTQRLINFGASITDSLGIRKGFIVMSVDARALFSPLGDIDVLESQFGSADRVIIDRSYNIVYLLDQETVTDLGFQTEKTTDTYPELMNFLTADNGFTNFQGVSVVFEKVYPNPDNTTDYYFALTFVRDAAVDFIAGSIGGQIILVNVLLFIFLVLGTYYITKKLVTDPVKKLASVAAKISKGDLSERVTPDSEDELGELGNGFNQMAENLTRINKQLAGKVTEKTDELASKLAEIEDKNVRLEQTKKAVLNVMEDIEAARERTDQEKVRSQAYLESIADGIIIIDRTGNIISVNQSFLDLLGSKLDDVIGKQAKLVINAIGKTSKGSILKLQQLPILDALLSGKKSKQDYYLIKSDSKRIPVSSTVAPVLLDNKAIGAVEVIRDITKEKEIDLAKSEFVSVVSHQLRTPITTLNWYTEMILEDSEGKMEPEKLAYIKEIREASFRMLDLVNALLDVSRIELGTMPISPEMLDLSEMAKSVLMEHKPQIESKKLNVDERYQEGLANFNADRKIMRMIFENLISNAVKYTPNDGKITVEVGKEDSAPEEKNNPSGWVVIKISDSGIGIPVEQQDKIFDKMFRADNVKELDVSGSGLGLYILKSVIENVGGKIWFTSELNKGSTFYVKLPASGMQKVTGAKPIVT